MADWRDIATAPKDGGWFLGAWYYGRQWRYRLGRWNERKQRFVEMPGAYVAAFTLWHLLPNTPRPDPTASHRPAAQPEGGDDG